jgi:hypothetical protein
MWSYPNDDRSPRTPVSANGKETASSAQHFASHYDAKRAAEHVKEYAATAEIVDK